MLHHCYNATHLLGELPVGQVQVLAVLAGGKAPLDVLGGGVVKVLLKVVLQMNGKEGNGNEGATISE